MEGLKQQLQRQACYSPLLGADQKCELRQAVFLPIGRIMGSNDNSAPVLDMKHTVVGLADILMDQGRRSRPFSLFHFFGYFKSGWRGTESSDNDFPGSRLDLDRLSTWGVIADRSSARARSNSSI